ncbi:unnamed protein product [Calypogeia fissa]
MFESFWAAGWDMQLIPGRSRDICEEGETASPGPLDPAILNKAQDFLKNYNRNYGIAIDGNWLLSGWRDRVLHGLTAWTCA